MSTYGTIPCRGTKFHFNANGFNPIPYAVFVRCVSTNAGTTSTAYSNLPRKGPGPTASVSTHPYRNPRFHTPVSDVLPFNPCPPPVHTCNSFSPLSGPACARIPDGPSSKPSISGSTRKHVFTGNAPDNSGTAHYTTAPPIQEGHTVPGRQKNLPMDVDISREVKHSLFRKFNLVNTVQASGRII